jgi:hypothetical protein
MSLRQIVVILGMGVAVLGTSMPASAQAPAAVPPQPTLWSFLGIPQAITATQDNLANRSGNRPRAERKPRLTRIADPENLKSDNPAIKRAAEIKKEEDLAKQKIKAVKYLTKIGCGCYNRDGSITDALLKALDDCTEEVRKETVKAIMEAANDEACVNCKNKSCCSEEISNKLYEMAYERDDAGCFLEPSERVRNLAAEALRACCPGRGFDEGYIIDETEGTMDGSGEIIPGGERPGAIGPGAGERPMVPPAAPPQPAPMPPALPGPELGPTPAAPPMPTADPAASILDETGTPNPAQKSSRRTAHLYRQQPEVAQASSQERLTGTVAFASQTFTTGTSAPAPAPPAAEQYVPEAPAATQYAPQAPTATYQQLGPAFATSVDLRNNQAMINFPGGEHVRVGTILRGYHTYAFTGKQPVGDFVVVQSTPGFAIVRPHGLGKLNKLSAGDELVVK